MTARSPEPASDDAAGSPDAAWEQRLRALDQRLAAFGATLDPPPDQSRHAAGRDESPARPSSATIVDDAPAAAAPDEALAAEGGSDEAAARAVPETPEEAAARRRKAIFDWVVVVGVALLVAFLVRTFVLAHFVVDGVSMSTTLHDEDRVFVNKLSYRLHDPNRGDVVVLHQLDGTSERDLIKRVIALPGETVEVQDCQITIDGRTLDEPYLDPQATTPGTCGGNQRPLLVPDQHVFVMGDNRGGSLDSRDLGPVSEDDLVGRAFVVFWPTSNWQWL